MRLFERVFLFIFFLSTLSLLLPSDVFAECKGQFDVPGECVSECTNLYSKRFSKYDCPPGSDIDPDTHERSCDAEDRVFNCSYPLWYEDSACTRETGYNPCSTWCSVNGTQACAAGVEGCKCGTGSICAPPDSNYSATQLCTGEFQQSTHGGCLDASCGYFCTRAAGCTEEYAYSIDPDERNYYLVEGAKNFSQCSATCNYYSCDPGVQGIYPPEYDGSRCRLCNENATWGSDGSNWGTVGGNTTQTAWCSCAQTFDSSQYNSTKYPQCFSGTSGSCQNSCTATSQCATGLTCTGGKCVNSSCATDTDCVCPTGGGGSACPGGVGACGNSTYGELESCSGNWSYSSNTSYDTWCSQQTNGSNPYCYACISSPGGGDPGGPGICSPGASSNVCRADSCVPGSTTTSP